MPSAGSFQSNARTDTLVAQPVMTQYQALRSVGWVHPVDYFCLFVIGMTFFTLTAWFIFGKPSPWNVLTCVLVAFAVLQVWTILLLYRCSRFILETHAYINTLPEVAAKMVMTAYSGNQSK